MASSNIARLGVVLGIDTAAFQADVDKAISENKKLKDAITRDTNAAVKEIANLKYATEDYGKEITKVAQIEREIADGRFKNTAPETVRLLRERAAAYDAVANSSKKAMGGMTSQQQLQLTYQTTDLITQIVSGQNAMIALMQQGGQLKDSMGGLAPMFKMLASYVTLTNVAIGASVVAVGALGYAFYKGAQEASTFRDQMILTNQYANLTLTGFQNLANVASNELHVGLTDAKDTLMALVVSGQFTEKSLGAVANVILQVSKLSGDSVNVVAGKLMPAFDGTASSAKRLNDQYHFLTLEQYKNIELLEKQNKFQEAAKLTAEAFTESLKGQERQLGLLEKTWNTVANAAKAGWAAILNIGAEKDAEKKLADLRNALANAQADISGGFANKDVAIERARRIQEQITKIETEEKAKRQKSAEAQKQTEDINDYAKNNQKRLNMADAIAKQELANDIAIAKQSETQIGKIELDAYQQIQEAKMQMDQKNRDEAGQFRTLNLKEYVEKVKSIEIDAAQKIKDFQDKVYKSKLDNEREYQQMLLDDQAKADDAYNAIIKSALQAVTIEQRALDLEEAKYQLRYEMIGMSDKEVALQQTKFEYAEKEYQIRQRTDLKQEDKDYLLKRNEEMYRQKTMLVEFIDQYKTLDEMAKSVYSNMGNYIDQFVRTGKFSFKDFARSVIQDLIAIQMKAQFTNLTGGGGGIASFLKGIFAGPSSYMPNSTAMAIPSGFAMAEGGSPPVGMATLVGEKGPEMFVPSTAGTIIPNNLLSGGGQTVNYNGPYIASMSAIDTQSGIQFLAKNKQTIWASYQSANRSVPVSR